MFSPLSLAVEDLLNTPQRKFAGASPNRHRTDKTLFPCCCCALLVHQHSQPHSPSSLLLLWSWVLLRVACVAVCYCCCCCCFGTKSEKCSSLLLGLALFERPLLWPHLAQLLQRQLALHARPCPVLASACPLPHPVPLRLWHCAPGTCLSRHQQRAFSMAHPPLMSVRSQVAILRFLSVCACEDVCEVV